MPRVCGQFALKKEVGFNVKHCSAMGKYKNTSENWNVNKYTVQCTNFLSMVWQCKLVSD